MQLWGKETVFQLNSQAVFPKQLPQLQQWNYSISYSDRKKNVRTNCLICYCNTSALKIKNADSSTKTAQMNIYERFQAMHPIRSAEIKWTL